MKKIISYVMFIKVKQCKPTHVFYWHELIVMYIFTYMTFIFGNWEFYKLIKLSFEVYSVQINFVNVQRLMIKM